MTKGMKKWRAFAWVFVLALSAQAQVPGLISYQGRVTDDGKAFTGTGYFKFALVNAAGDLAYWSNDGTGYWPLAGPDSAVPIEVDRGLFSVYLGDHSLPNMTEDLASVVFENANVHLRVWFSDDGETFEQLEPDTPIGSVGYAMMASRVANNSITHEQLANGSVVAAKIANNAVSAEKIVDATITSNKLDWTTMPEIPALRGYAESGDFSTPPVASGYNAIALGNNNEASATEATVSGGAGNVANASSATVSGGGFNTASDNGATVGGGESNEATAGYSTVAGGENNVASDYHATVGGGYYNHADGQYAFVGGGEGNQALALESVVGGGTYNLARGRASVIAGGERNVASNNYSSVGGGYYNEATAEDATVGGGRENQGRGARATVAGGVQNVAAGFGSAIGGGAGNSAANDYTAVAGGQSNTATNNFAAVAGGEQNTANGEGAFVGGGQTNTASGANAVVAGGSGNAAGGDGFVGGGSGNQATALYATIGGGLNNEANVMRGATIAGGENNKATGERAAVGGGFNNNAYNWYATIPGGRDNQAGEYAFAAGRRAKALQPGSFVWGDSTDADVVAFVNDSVTFRASGGYVLFSNSGMTLGAQLPANMTTWSALSDRNAKENFAEIDTADILEKLGELPLTAWNYKADPDQRRYIGPVAQDFHAAFGLGNDTTINTLDADGVAFAAIQALNRKVTDLEAENAELKARLERLETALFGLSTK